MVANKLSYHGDLIDQISQTTSELQENSLKVKKNMDVTLYMRYNDVIQDHLQQGICEYVPENTSAAKQPEAVKYYMLHPAVLQEGKVTNKLRVA